MSSQPKWSLGCWAYEWNANGSLHKIKRADGKVFTFKYDAFGRRISKSYHRREFLYIWDKNVPLHEIQKEELCEDNVITWIFEGFTPTAKLINGKAYSIISDHIGTPILAIDTQGNKVWERELDIYGKVRKEFTSDDVANRRCGFIPFLYAGQYYDKETELAYNRFRYYDPNSGNYISQDPIGLLGNNPTLYGYVFDNNVEVDVFGLDCSKPKGKKIKGTAYRYEDKDRLDTTWTPHKWNIAANHRYTKQGVGGVYAGTSQETAFKEITHYPVDMSNRVLVSKNFELNNVLDLTDQNVRNQLGVSLEDITGNDYNITHKIGDFAVENGYDGILAPSARNINGSNIIIFKGL